MNLTAEDLASGVLRDRVKVGASLADVDPMNLDTSVSKTQIKTKTCNNQEVLLYLLLYPLCCDTKSFVF